MTDSSFILNSAYIINNMDNVEDIASYYIENSLTCKTNIYNRITMLLTMCINKELSILLVNNNIVEEKYFTHVQKIYDEIYKKYINLNKKLTNQLEIEASKKEEACEYLNNFVVCLLSGVKYIEKKKGKEWHEWDYQNEWNTRFRREERIRDYMKTLFSVNGKYTSFTKKNKIEIPYMYVLAWDLSNLFENFFEKCESHSYDNTSYFGNLRKNTCIELKSISDYILDILLTGYKIDDQNIDDNRSNEFIIHYRTVNFEKLLPTISIGERINYYNDLLEPTKRFEAKKLNQLPPIKREVLQKVPLLPMEVDNNIFKPITALKMMLNLLKEETKTKEYLESQIYDLKNIIEEINILLCEYIDQTTDDILKISRPKAKKYLEDIIHSADMSISENTSELKKTYLKNLLSVIVKIWDSSQLDKVKVTNGEYETYISFAYFSVLKLTRNWDAHNLINNVSFLFVIFILIISLRYLFNNMNNFDAKMKQKYLEVESKLLKFFKCEPSDSSKDDPSEIEKEYRILYKNVYQKVLNDNNSRLIRIFPKENCLGDPHQVLTIAGDRDSLIKNQMSENEIYLAFWLAIHMGKAHNETINVSESVDINLKALLNNIYEYKKGSFLLYNKEKMEENLNVL